MADHAITLQEVETLAASRGRRAAWSSALEARYEEETGPRRARFLSKVAVRTAIVYNLFLIGDYLLAPDTLALAAFLHLAIVTPWILFVAHVLPSVRSPQWREGLAASISIAMVAQILTIYCLSHTPTVVHYVYFAPVTLIMVATIQRTESICALRMSAFVMAMTIAALIVQPHLPLQVALAQCATFAVCAGVMINSNHLVAREQRRAFLLALRERMRAELSDTDAKVDALTGLGNRRFLDMRAAQLWSGGARSVAAIMVDVDHFKSFNDRYGHSRGDGCLKRIAACATSELRTPSDVGIRFGGEEFLMLVVDADVAVAEAVAERIRAAIEAIGVPHADSPFEVVTASFGIAAGDTRHSSLGELIEAADEALYDAKRAGRNRTRRHERLAHMHAA